MCYGACTQCGNCRGEAKKFQTGLCFYCNTENDPEADVCVNCGKKLLKPLNMPKAENAQAAREAAEKGYKAAN